MPTKSNIRRVPQPCAGRNRRAAQPIAPRPIAPQTIASQPIASQPIAPQSSIASIQNERGPPDNNIQVIYPQVSRAPISVQPHPEAMSQPAVSSFAAPHQGTEHHEIKEIEPLWPASSLITPS